jgi:hypothetical protein
MVPPPPLNAFKGRGNGGQLRQSFIFWSGFQTRRQLSNEMQRKNQFAKAIAMLMANGIEKVL